MDFWATPSLRGSRLAMRSVRNFAGKVSSISMPEVYQSQENRDGDSHDKGSGRTSDWVEYVRKGISSLEIIWRDKENIAKLSGGLSVLFLVYLIWVPGTYVSTTTILPDVQGLENLQKRGALGDLAAAAGLSMGLSPSQLYPDIIQSERLLGQVMRMKFHLKEGDEAKTPAEIWDLVSADSVREFENTIKKLRKSMEVTFDRRSLMVTVQVGTQSPLFSADLANAIATTLDRLSLEFSRHLAGQKGRWIESRLSEVQSELTRSEDNLKQFRERNRSVANSPELLLQQARLGREVEINSTIFVELKKQLEVARVEEARTSSIVNILDTARPAYGKSGLARRYMFALFFLMVLTLNIAYILLSDQIRSNPVLMTQLRRLNVKSLRKRDGEVVREHLADRH